MNLWTLAALFLLLGFASCAPTRPACDTVRTSSLMLNQVARNVSTEARNGSNDVSNFSLSPEWMEAQDMCDPNTLRKTPAICIGKMLDVLTDYSAAVEKVSGLSSCSESARKLRPVMGKLLDDMRVCMRSKAGNHHQRESHISSEEPLSLQHWQEALLCHHTLDRLFSFSILTARVFAVGDPAHHSDGSAQTCK